MVPQRHLVKKDFSEAGEAHLVQCPLPTKIGPLCLRRV